MQTSIGMGDNNNPAKPRKPKNELPKNEEQPQKREQSSQSQNEGANEGSEGGDVQYVDRGGRIDEPGQAD